MGSENEKKPPEWWLCNDGIVHKIEDKNKLVGKEAYILFYKRKEFTASNIINLASNQF